jgi:uncharacterized membrane protein YfcA
MAIFAEYKSKRALSLTSISEHQKTEFSPTLKAVSRIEIPSILFFLGILMTVAALESTGLIHDFGKTVNQSMSSFQFVTLIGFASAILIGVSLGLIGGGGSILTVPVLVYILGVNPVLATAYSLFVVGSTSLVGAATYMKKGLVNYKTALVFAIPSFIAVFLTRKFLVPALPDPLFTVGEAIITKNIGIMVFFALIMLAASYSMITAKKCVDCDEDEPVVFNFPMIALEGSVVGVITGIVGAG